MEINPVTVITQVLNFFIFVWLLKKLLYKPILSAMNERERIIASRLDDAREQAENARKEASAFRQKNEEFDRQVEEMLAEACEKAENLRKELSKEARKEIDENKERWLEQLEGERNALRIDVRKEALNHFNALGRDALGDLADADLEERIGEVFVKQINKQKSDLKENFAKAKDAGLLVESSYKVSKKMADKITKAIEEAAGTKDIELEFEQADDITCGFRLKIGGWAILWSLDSYLDTLEEELDAALSGLIASSGATSSEEAA